MKIELPKIKSHHIKFTKESAKWSIPASNLILDLMLNETCLIYFYSTQHQATFQSFLSRSPHKDNVEKRQMKAETWVLCNKNNPEAMEAMSQIPKIAKNIHLAPSLNSLLETGQAQITAIEDTCTLCKRYYKTAFFKQTQKPVMMYANKKGYRIEIVDFTELSPENRQSMLLEE